MGWCQVRRPCQENPVLTAASLFDFVSRRAQHHGFWVSHRDQQGSFLLPTLSPHLFSWWLRHLNVWSHWKLLYATLLYNYETVPKLNLFLNLKWVDGDLPFTQIISRKRILRIRIHDAQNFSENAVRNPSLSVFLLSHTDSSDRNFAFLLPSLCLLNELVFFTDCLRSFILSACSKSYGFSSPK